MAIDYDRINFKNLPDTTTPISAENLNLMDETIDELVTAVNALEIKETTFTVTTTAQGAFYLDDLTEANSIILQISSTEQYFYVFRVGGGGAWVGCALTGNITPLSETTIHVTVKYIAI